MKSSNRIGQLWTLAVGLGIGAVAATAGIASADTSSPVDPLALIDPFPSIDSAQSIDLNDYAVSIDGVTLFHNGTATATSDMGDIAIAIGDHSNATANNGIGDFASAFGDNSNAFAAGGNFNTATSMGTGAFTQAFAGNGNAASVFGDNSFGVAFNGNNDIADVFANNGGATAGGALGGSNDLAYVLDPFEAAYSTAIAGQGGSFDLAAALGADLDASAITHDFIVSILPML